MFREPPVNFIISFAILAIIWLFTALFIVSWLGDNITTLQILPIEEFQNYLKIVLALSGIFTLLASFLWFYWGDKSVAAAKPDKAKKIWFSLFFSQIGISVLFVFIVFIYLTMKGEKITFFDYLVLYLSFSLQTFLAFWFVTFFFSPVNVKYIPFLKK